MVVINIHTNFGSILPSRLKKTKTKTDANTNCTNSPLQIILMRRTFKSNWKCTLLWRTIIPNLKALTLKLFELWPKVCFECLSVRRDLDPDLWTNFKLFGRHHSHVCACPKYKSSDQRFLINGPYKNVFDLASVGLWVPQRAIIYEAHEVVNHVRLCQGMSLSTALFDVELVKRSQGAISLINFWRGLQLHGLHK